MDTGFARFSPIYKIYFIFLRALLLLSNIGNNCTGWIYSLFFVV